MAQENVTALPARQADKPAATSSNEAAKTEAAKSAEVSKTKKAPKTTAAKKTPKATAKKPAAKVAKKAVSKAVKAGAKSVSAQKNTVKKAVQSQAKAAEKMSAATATAAQRTTQQSFNPANLNPMMEKMMYQGKSQFDKLAQDAAEMNRENIEAVVKCSTIFAKGFEDLMRVSMTLAQDAAERQGKFMKEVLSSKTLNEFTEAQNKVAQVNFDEFVNGATKITELSMKVMTDSLEPLNAQMNKGINKASQKMAA